MMILTGDRFYPNAENLLSILILQFVLFMHVFHLLYFVSNDNNKDVQSIIQNPLCHQNQAIKVNQRQIKIRPTKSWLTTTSSSGTVEVLGVIEKTLLITKYSPAAICLQETMLKRDQIQTFKHYSAYYKNSINRHGGVCILVKNNFIHSQVQFQADLQAVAVCITINN